jgi:transcription-repair coupling factor (superfamily II helicase)
MHEGELEPIMKEFVAGRFDVLVSTVIIENGIDIPNVNTIIVIRAEVMGLSQLYQLRGRVGRSSEQAYAYFLTAPFREIQEAALRRLRALEQYTDLGSGFQIAMRDLEIRGAGNILGTRQHGFIAAVGFEMYCRLLDEAVKEVRGEKPGPAHEEAVGVDIPVEAFIPTDYVADPASRVALYQELSAAKGSGDIDEIEKEVVDRFGSMPQAVNSLFLLMRIKVSAKNAGCSKVSVNSEGMLSLTLAGEGEAVHETIKRIITPGSRRFNVTNTVPVLLTTALRGATVLEWALEAKILLQSMEIKA